MNPGVFYLTGGKVFEDDGKTPLQLGGSQATLDTLISKPSQSYNHQYTPQQDDAINYTGVSYTLNIRHDMLSMTHGMLTAGCTPEISADKAAVAATVRDTVTKQQDTLKILNDLPDLDRLLAEVGTALNSFRNNVSEDGAHLLRDSIIASLDKVKQETLKSIEKIVLSNFDRYKSKLSLDTDMQFTTLPIKVRLEVMDSNGQPMSSNLPASVGAEISKAMSAKTTLGSASAFQYDGSKYFYSDITSSNAGQGVVSAVFNSNVIANLDIPEDLSKSISVSTNSLTYSFIFASAVGGESGIDSTQRRDSSDIANDAGSSSDVGINIQGV
jgi:hypothetical protein